MTNETKPEATIPEKADVEFSKEYIEKLISDHLDEMGYDTKNIRFITKPRGFAFDALGNPLYDLSGAIAEAHLKQEKDEEKED